MIDIVCDLARYHSAILFW